MSGRRAHTGSFLRGGALHDLVVVGVADSAGRAAAWGDGDGSVGRDRAVVVDGESHRRRRRRGGSVHVDAWRRGRAVVVVEEGRRSGRET